MRPFQYALSALDAWVESYKAPAPPALLQLPVPQSRSQGGAPAGGEAARYGELHGDGPKERSRGRQEDSSHSPWQSDEEHWPPTVIRAQCRAPPREQQDEAPLSRPLHQLHLRHLFPHSIPLTATTIHLEEQLDCHVGSRECLRCTPNTTWCLTKSDQGLPAPKSAWTATSPGVRQRLTVLKMLW